MRVLENCEPKQVFYYFEEICKIPHGSRNTKQISDYLVAFAKEHGFDYVQDEMNNVIIYKPATPGYENAPTVILQGHMDMVCEKRPDSNHDFTKDPLELQIVDGNIVAVKYKEQYGLAFHPELDEDDRIHEAFLNSVKKYAKKNSPNTWL